MTNGTHFNQVLEQRYHALVKKQKRKKYPTVKYAYMVYKVLKGGQMEIDVFSNALKATRYVEMLLGNRLTCWRLVDRGSDSKPLTGRTLFNTVKSCGILRDMFRDDFKLVVRKFELK
jgi:hypothetical protein